MRVARCDRKPDRLRLEAWITVRQQVSTSPAAALFGRHQPESRPVLLAVSLSVLTLGGRLLLRPHRRASRCRTAKKSSSISRHAFGRFNPSTRRSL
jgi:hypothetical protein